MNGRNWYHRICCRPGGCHSQPLSQSEHTDVGRGVTVTPVTRCGNLQRLLLLHKTRPRCTELIRSTFAMLPPPGEPTPPPPTSRFQPIGQALVKFAVWSIAARERPVKVHSTKRLKRLERLENISLRIRTWRRLTFGLQAPVGILKPLRKSVLGRSQEPRSRDQRDSQYPHRRVQHQTRAVTHARHKPLTDFARFPWKIRTSPGQTDGKQWNNDHRNSHSTDKFTTFVRVPRAVGEQTPWLQRLPDSIQNPSPPSIIKSLLIRSISCQ